LLDPTQKVPEKKKEEENKKEKITRNVRPSEGQEVLKPKDNSYLSDKNKITQEERSARQSGDLNPGLKAMESKPKPVAQVVPKTSAKAVAKSIKVSDLGVKISMREPTPQEKQQNWAENSMGENVRGGEFIKGLKEGETSALNTKEGIFFAYFQRIRHQLDQTWPSLLREQFDKITRSGRHLAGETYYTTSTVITVNAKGEIIHVQVLGESGAVDLDDAAISAWNKAGPYPNPPKGLLDADGTATIRWDFILKT